MIQFKKYSKYKDSGVEWIGEIPEHWENKKISHSFGKIQSGITPSTNKEEYYENGKISWVTSGDLNDSKIVKTKKCISEKALQEIPQLEIFPENCLLIAMIGATVGKVGINTMSATSNQNCCVLQNPKKINTDYLFYWFIGNRKSVITIATGGAQAIMNQNLIKNLKVPSPNLLEQQQIAEFLDKQTKRIDSEIEKNQKLIELLKEKRQSTINQAVTKGLDPTVPMKDSGIEWIGEIPEHWKIERVKFHTKINHKTLDENTEPESMIHYIDISSVNSNGNISSPEQMNFNDAPSRARRILTEGDCIVSTVRTYLRAIAYISSVTNKLICSTGFAVLSPNSNLDSKFLFYQIRNEGFIENIMANSVGVTYPAINSSLLGTFPVIIVPKIEQKQIAEFLDKETTKIDSLITKTESQIEKLEEFRQSLITSAVTGKIDVRGIAA